MSKNPSKNEKGEYRGVVYMYWNRETGKGYIGETDNEEVRRQSWFKKSSSNYAGKKLREARAIYPPNHSAWKYEVLDEITAATHEELLEKLIERETFRIAEKDTYENGYNGNRGGSGNKGVKFDDARRKQNGNNRRGKPQSEVTKQKISDKLKGHAVSAETREKISKGNASKKRTPAQNQAQSQRMKGRDTTKLQEGHKEWIAANGGHPMKGKHITNPTALANMKAAQRAKGTKVIAIAPDGTEKKYQTMLEAAKATNLNVGSVDYAVKHNTHAKKNGYRFRRA